jgi:plasmid stability protein
MRLTLRLTDEQLLALRARAEKDGRSMHQVAFSALDEYLLRAEDAEQTERLAQRYAELPRRLSE